MNLPDPCQALCEQAYAAYQEGDGGRCAAIIQSILQQNPNHPRTLYLQGILSQESGKHEEALGFITLAFQHDPNAVYANAVGELHNTLGEKEKGFDLFNKSVMLNPGYARAWNNMGIYFRDSNQTDLALEAFRKAVSLNPRYALAWNNMGVVYLEKKAFPSARDCFANAIKAAPQYPEAYFNLGSCLMEMCQPHEAANCFTKAIEFRPAYDKAHFQLGQLFQKFRNDFAALDCFRKAVELKPDNATYARVLGDHLLVKKDWEEGLRHLEKAVELQTEEGANHARLFHAKQLLCDWKNYEAKVEILERFCQEEMQQGKSLSVGPFQSLTLPWQCSRLQEISRAFSNRFEKREWQGSLAPGGRIRIGYISGDLYDHAVGHLLHGFFEKHDRQHFEVTVYSFSPDKESLYRKRMQQGAEHFVNVTPLDTAQMVKRIGADGIQILVDLMGYTGVARTEVFAMRPAPLQVSFIGMLGTMGAPFIDYLVADPQLITAEMEPFFDEKLLRMPHSYLIAERIEPGPATSREEHGLPEKAFVFCSFNNGYKLEPRTWDCWMHILKKVPGSVLWLSSTSSMVDERLKKEASTRGVEPGRILFARFADAPIHIERQRHADLFLDTFVYNAAATACMAFQAGLPVLTLRGNTFASRVGTSLVNAIGMPQMCAGNSEEYIHIAVELATQAKKLRKIKKQLTSTLFTSPLFDSTRFVKNLEKGFATILERHQRGLTPVSHVIEE